MKKPNLFYVLFSLGILLVACAWSQTLLPNTRESPEALPNTSETPEVANWDAWSFTWKTAEKFADVTVSWGDEQKTYLPEQPNYLFLAVQYEIVNTSDKTQEIHLPQGPMYLTDKEQNVFDLVGLAWDDTILMAVLATWFIRQVFWIFRQKFRQAIALFRPGRARFIL
jgi:hypothetical protein